MATAAERFAAWRPQLRLEDVPGEVVEAREAARARHARLRARGARARRRRRGPRDDGRARRRAPGDRDRPRERPARGERRVRERDALPRARLRRHALRLGRHVRRVVVPGRRSPPPRRTARAAGSAHGDRRRQRDRDRIGMAAPGAFHERGFHPTAVCGIFGATAAAARLGGLDAGRRHERARDRRLDGVGPLRLPRGRDRDEADPSGLGGARRRCSRRGSPPTARRARRPSSRAVRPLPRSSTRAGRSTSSRSSPISDALGDAAHRLQAVSRPATSCTDRSARPAGALGRARPGRDRRRRRHRARGRGVARARAGGRRRSPRGPTTRGSSRSSTRWPRCSSAVGSASPTTRDAIADPAVLALARKVRYETPDYRRTRRRSPAACASRSRDGRTLEADFPYQRAARRTR